LVPGDPTVVTICRYAGLNRPVRVGTLIRSVVLRDGVAALAAELNVGRDVGPASYSCPADDGARAVLLFSYPRGPALPVVVDLAGCRFASNGARAVFTRPQLHDRLAALVGADPFR
jgi:hypothetical protein